MNKNISNGNDVKVNDNSSDDKHITTDNIAF